MGSADALGRIYPCGNTRWYDNNGSTIGVTVEQADRMPQGLLGQRSGLLYDASYPGFEPWRWPSEARRLREWRAEHKRFVCAIVVGKTTGPRASDERVILRYRSQTGA